MRRPITAGSSSSAKASISANLMLRSLPPSSGSGVNTNLPRWRPPSANETNLRIGCMPSTKGYWPRSPLREEGVVARRPRALRTPTPGSGGQASSGPSVATTFEAVSARWYVSLRPATWSCSDRRPRNAGSSTLYSSWTSRSARLSHPGQSALATETRPTRARCSIASTIRLRNGARCPDGRTPPAGRCSRLFPRFCRPEVGRRSSDQTSPTCCGLCTRAMVSLPQSTVLRRQPRARARAARQCSGGK